MNIWERLARVFVKEQRDDVKETLDLLNKQEQEKAIEEKKEEKKIPIIEVSIKGVYSLYTDYYDDEDRSNYTWDKSGFRVMLKVNAVATLSLYGRNREVKLTDEVEEIFGRTWYEETLCKKYMELEEEEKQRLIKKGMAQMVVRKVCDQQLKDFKEAFNLANKKTEFDIKIEITQDNFHKE